MSQTSCERCGFPVPMSATREALPSGYSSATSSFFPVKSPAADIAAFKKEGGLK